MVGELLAHVETHCQMASEGDVETTTVDLPILEEKKGFVVDDVRWCEGKGREEGEGK